jgi:teichuronic acid biosynthesis glycosyltransferase TuaC
MKVLTFTSLYPNALQPRHGVFIEHRVRQLALSGQASVRVIAPVPWLPAAWSVLGRHAVLARVARREVRDGIDVRHPRFLAIPKLTSWFNPVTMALGALPEIRRLREEGGDFDLIDAHFLFPDAAAAALLGMWLGKPVIATARGTDANVFPGYRVPRAWIKWLARHVAALITVSASLREALLRLGIAPGSVSVLRNGVDLELFHPHGRRAARQALQLRGPTLLSVGHLLEDKGHALAIEALTELPDVELVIVGDGPQRAQLEAAARRYGVAERVRWTGTLPQLELTRYYSAADATVLASRIEGMPNVVLESLACGTPVIATAVGGIPEIVNAPEAGVLIERREAGAIAAAYRALMRNPPAASDVRRHAELFAWGPTTQGLLMLFSSVLERARAAKAAMAGVDDLGA